MPFKVPSTMPYKASTQSHSNTPARAHRDHGLADERRRRAFPLLEVPPPRVEEVHGLAQQDGAVGVRQAVGGLLDLLYVVGVELLRRWRRS